MAQNKIVFRILVAASIIFFTATVAFGAGYCITAAENEVLKAKYHEMTETFQVSQEALILIDDWYKADGYEDAESWWKAYQEYKTNLAGLKSKVENSENAGYVTEDQLKRLEAMDNEVKEARSINKLKELSVEFDSITQAIADSRYAAEAAAAASYLYSGGGSSYDTPSGGLTMQSGVNYHDGRIETYYSSNVAYHYRTSEWTVDNEGFYRDNDGNYVVAASDKNEGDTYQGSKGQVKVYDGGCDAGVTDYYTAW